MYFARNLFLVANQPLTIPVKKESQNLVIHLVGFGGVCPKGHFCRVRSTLPEGCPDGSYQDEEGQTYCKSCPAGYVCLAKATTFNDTVCPSGSYCLVNTSIPILCDEGTFNALTGQKEESNCVLCTAGKYCEGSGLSKPTADCYGGWFCKNGSTKPTPDGGKAFILQVYSVLRQQCAHDSTINRDRYASDIKSLTIQPVYVSFIYCTGNHCDFMVGLLSFGLSFLGLSAGQGHCLVLLGKTLFSHSVSLHPGVQMGAGIFNPVGNPANQPEQHEQ